MNTFLQILSQVAWALTGGALFAVLAAGGKMLAVACGLTGGACLMWWRRKKRGKLR